MSVPDVTILISAAGQSSRMLGTDKLLEVVDGLPLLARQARAALATGCPVIVALPPEAGARKAALADLPVHVVKVARADLGMGESLRTGMSHVPPGHGAMVMLADMPEIERGDLEVLLAAFRDAGGTRIVRAAAADGTPGHPVIFPPAVLPAFDALGGDQGARDILRAHAVHLVALPDRRALVDLDTPEDWAEWRAARRGQDRGPDR